MIDTDKVIAWLRKKAREQPHGGLMGAEDYYKAASMIEALAAEAVSSKLAHDCGFNAATILGKTYEAAAFTRGFKAGLESAAKLAQEAADRDERDYGAAQSGAAEGLAAAIRALPTPKENDHA